MTAKRPDRSPLYMIVAALVALAAGYSGFWLYAKDRFKAALEETAAARRAAGDQLSWSVLSYGGFPFRLEARFTGFEASAAGLTVSAPELRLYALPWKAGHLIAEVPSLVAALPEALTLSAGVSRASLLISGARPVRADADLASAVLKDEFGRERAAASRFQVHARLGSGPGDGPRENYDLAVSLSGAVFSEALPVAGTRLTEARLVVRLKEAPPFARGFSAPDAEMVWTALRDNKTVADIAELTLAWADIRAKGRGTLMLDPALRPEGRIDWTVQGLGPLIDTLRAQGLIAPLQDDVISAALAALPAAPDGVSIPLILKDGQAALGPFDAGRVPPLGP